VRFAGGRESEAGHEAGRLPVPDLAAMRAGADADAISRRAPR
jgi:hypothetical protein